MGFGHREHGACGVTQNGGVKLTPIDEFLHQGIPSIGVTDESNLLGQSGVIIYYAVG